MGTDVQAGAEPAVVLDCRNNLGESIVWDDRANRLRWADIHRRGIWTWHPADGREPDVLRLPERPGAIGLRRGEGLVVGLEKGFALIGDGSGAPEPVAAVDADLPTVRLNDGRVDPAGRFLCGGMDEAAPLRPLASLYALSADGGVRTVLTGIHCTNSLCWSPDGRTLYLTDMPTRRIDALDYDPATGAATNRRPFADLAGEPGLPDGSAVDAEGCLWNAQWEGAKLVRYRPDGSVEREVPMPVSNPTCLCFGGPDLDILYVTSAWFTLSDAQRRTQPQAGSLFAFRPGVRGLPEHRFAG